MSVTVANPVDFSKDTVPRYYGKTAAGEDAVSEDTKYLAETTLYFLRSVNLEFSELSGKAESSGALSRFSRLQSSLWDLRSQPEADHFGQVRPSESAISTAVSVLFPLVGTGFALPQPLDVGTDHDGAIRVVWENGPRFLELVVPVDAEAYLYYSEGDQYAIESDLRAVPVRTRFNWLRTTHS